MRPPKRWGSKARSPDAPCAPNFSPSPRARPSPPYRILITGGSQGSLVINRAVVDAADLLAAQKNRISIVHQTGERDYNAVRLAYARREINAEVAPFIANMAERFAQADLIVCRAGAITVAEIAAAGRAAIFIPFGAATDSHQLRNAQEMAARRRGAADPGARADRRTPCAGNSGVARPARRSLRSYGAQAPAAGAAARRRRKSSTLIEGGRAAMMVDISQFQAHSSGGHRRHRHERHRRSAADAGLCRFRLGPDDLRRSPSACKIWARKFSKAISAEHVHGAHVVVASSAIRRDNPEVVEAHRLKIPVIPRAEMLAELMRLKYGIAVAGAHGKTTTTSMTARVLAAAGLDPTFVVGGRVNQVGTTARLGRGEYMVVEADESDRTFLLLAPVVAVVTTIDREHLDITPRSRRFRTSSRSSSIACRFTAPRCFAWTSPTCRPSFPTSRARSSPTALRARPTWSSAKSNCWASPARFRLTYRGDDLGKFHLPGPPGIHNVRNAAAAAAVALYLNVPADLIRAGLEEFHRRGRGGLRSRASSAASR